MSKKRKRNRELNNRPPGENPADFEKSEWEKKIIEVIKYLSFAIPFAAIFNIKSFFYPNVFTKMIFFYGLIELMGALYLVLALKSRNYLPAFFSQNDSGKKEKNWIFIFLFLYLAIVAVTNLFSINPYASFFGTINWTNGLLTLMHFFILFIVLSSTFKSDNFWLNFFRINSGVGLYAALYGLSQRILYNNPAPMASFGNPVHFSAYLIFIIFGALVLFFWENKKEWKIFHGLVLATSLLAIFWIIDVRGSQLGVIAGLAAAVFFYFLGHENKKIRKAAVLLAAAGLVILAMLSFLAISSGKIYSIFERSYTVKTRLIAWEAGVRGFLDRPLAGYGLENYIVPFEKYFNPKYYNQENGMMAAEYGVDFPHNKLVEVAVSNGIFALLAYILLFVSIFWRLYWKYRETWERKYLALLGLFMAHFVNLFFLFDNIVTFAMFFAFLAYLGSQYSNVSAKEIEKQKKYILPISVSAAVVLFAVSFYYFVVKPVSVNYDFVQAINSFKSAKYQESMKYMDKMRRENVYWIEQQAIFNQMMQAHETFDLKDNMTENEKEYIRKMIEAGEYNISRNPYRYYDYILLGTLNNIGGKFDEKYWKRNVELMEKIIRAGTRRYEAYVILADAYARTGQGEKVEKLEKAALDLDPDYSYPYFVFSRTYAQMNDDKKAHELLEKAYEKGCSFEMCYEDYANVNIEKKEYAKAIPPYRKLAEAKPNDPQIQANLAMLYFNNKEYGKARELAGEIKKKFPATAKTIDEFLAKFPK